MVLGWSLTKQFPWAGCRAQAGAGTTDGLRLGGSERNNQVRHAYLGLAEHARDPSHAVASPKEPVMERFLDWFEEHKFGVIITLTLHSMLLFVFTLVELRAEPEVMQTSVSHVDVLQPEQAEELMQRIEHPELAAAMKVTNATSNITAEKVASTFSQARLAERVENDLKAMEQAEFDRLAQERRDQGKEIVIPELDPSKWNKEQYMKSATGPVKVEGATLVEYDLRNRTRGEGKPGYLCKDFGQVVVYVEVDRSGKVRKAEFDQGRSTQVNECMLEQALRSARETPFNANSAAPEPQTGTITFTFVAQ